ncbi:MAG: GMC oxidoreductase [Desertimonas sp.]
MLIDGRRVPSGTCLEADVCIIGAGPAGLTAAACLALTGVCVLLLEAAGRRHRRRDDDALRGAATADPFPFVASRHRGFGGTSTHWTRDTGLRIRPLDISDFHPTPVRPHDSWPFGRETLDPFYDAALEQLGTRRPDDEPEVGLGGGTPGPGGDPGLAMFQFVDHDIFTRQFDAFAADPRVTIALHAPVRSMDVDPASGAVRRLHVARPSGGAFSVSSRVVLLASGALDNARSLLASPGLTGAGVGNEHDVVGRYFMDHLSIDAGVVRPTDGRDLHVDAFRERTRHGMRVEPMLWLGDREITARGLINAAFWVDERDAGYLSPGVGAARTLRNAQRNRDPAGVARSAAPTLRGLPDIVRFGIGRCRTTPRRDPVVGLRILAEQLPNRNSRVRLARQRDRHGIPRAALDWRVTADDRRSMADHYRALGERFRTGGKVELHDPYDGSDWGSPMMTNYHHLGTTRIHVDPRRGVVDADCRVHSAPNLFVLGGSVFPTGGYVNPTLTILALAHRVAANVKRELTTRTALRPIDTEAVQTPIGRGTQLLRSVRSHVTSRDRSARAQSPSFHRVIRGASNRAR